jgi:hypothetical protein
VIEAYITEAIGLPLEGERYFKGMMIDLRHLYKCLAPENSNLGWVKGIPRHWVKPEYSTMLFSLQIF